MTAALESQPTAADLDAAAAEQKAREATTPPTPEDVDTKIALYEEAKRNYKAAKKVMDDAEEVVVQLADKWGHPAPGAERSTRLEGKRNEATVTRGTTIVINETAVAAFRAFLFGNKLEGLFPKFFAAETKHKLVKGARDVVKGVQLAQRVEEKLASLFGRAFDVKTNEPSLKVKTITPEKPVRAKRTAKAGA